MLLFDLENCVTILVNVSTTELTSLECKTQRQTQRAAFVSKADRIAVRKGIEWSNGNPIQSRIEIMLRYDWVLRSDTKHENNFIWYRFASQSHRLQCKAMPGIYQIFDCNQKIIESYSQVKRIIDRDRDFSENLLIDCVSSWLIKCHQCNQYQ